MPVERFAPPVFVAAPLPAGADDVADADVASARSFGVGTEESASVVSAASGPASPLVVLPLPLPLSSLLLSLPDPPAADVAAPAVSATFDAALASAGAFS